MSCLRKEGLTCVQGRVRGALLSGLQNNSFKKLLIQREHISLPVTILFIAAQEVINIFFIPPCVDLTSVFWGNLAGTLA